MLNMQSLKQKQNRIFLDHLGSRSLYLSYLLKSSFFLLYSTQNVRQRTWALGIKRRAKEKKNDFSMCLWLHHASLYHLCCHLCIQKEVTLFIKLFLMSRKKNLSSCLLPNFQPQVISDKNSTVSFEVKMLYLFFTKWYQLTIIATMQRNLKLCCQGYNILLLIVTHGYTLQCNPDYNFFFLLLSFKMFKRVRNN